MPFGIKHPVECLSWQLSKEQRRIKQFDVGYVLEDLAARKIRLVSSVNQIHLETHASFRTFLPCTLEIRLWESYPKIRELDAPLRLARENRACTVSITSVS